jgi:peptide methionine sulfoxide reductase msrA/msrB
MKNRLLVLLSSLFAIGCDPTEAKEATVMYPDNPVRYSKSGHDITPLGKERVAELAKKLTPEQYAITQASGTERPFCSGLLDNKKTGTYACVVCGLPLFESGSKFDSGTGWPSFFQPVDKAHVAEIVDKSHGMVRIETRCARCSAHLGHVFEDGPPPTGLRYCMNGEALTFFEKGAELPPESRPVSTQTAYFAGGCFWGVEDVFAQIPGVVDAESGYMGGKTANPTYKQVCYEDTGHAEVVKVVFDPARVTFAQLLDTFFKNHDPTTLNRQGPDVGDQYRSAIFAATPEQKAEATRFVAELGKRPEYQKRPIVTQVVDPGVPYFAAEDYHQDYHAKHGGSCKVVK